LPIVEKESFQETTGKATIVASACDGKIDQNFSASSDCRTSRAAKNGFLEKDQQKRKVRR